MYDKVVPFATKKRVKGDYFNIETIVIARPGEEVSSK